ncbi:hypothetical protein [Natrinema versiforme]|uniref:Membrane-bound metal-dependent hydrolase n=1 Tax=Natrinema versiforme JCM 10478 TaxID=1227496 RepID=L9Y7M2_9EURY|nr:hypothetical protein [Natrinema versiforme]ELY70055.1 hypothetical protein C489_03871 [Natrinema versiforme JCM 10478]
MSVVVAGLLTASLAPISLFGYAVPAAIVVAYGTAVGVFIDLDHFLIARFKTGDWDAVRFCLANPGTAATDQSEIFDPGDVGVLSRLLSHVVIAGVVVPSIALASVPLAIVTGAVLYVHLLADLVWDIYLLEGHADAADSLAEFVRMVR